MALFKLEKDGVSVETTIASEAVQLRAAGFKDATGTKTAPKADNASEAKADSKTSK